MRSSKLLLALLILGVIALSVSAPATAGIINMTTPTTLFYDDFEAYSPVSTVAYPDGSGDYDPTAGTAGTWAFTEPNPNRIQVTDYATPGAFQGSKYLRAYNEASQMVAYMNFARQSTIGEKIHFEQMVYIGKTPIVGSLPFLIIGLDGSSTRRFHLVTSTSQFGLTEGQVACYDSGPSAPIPGLTYTAGVWQKWEIDYAIGTTLIDVTIDGTKVSNISTGSLPGGALDRIKITTGSDSGTIAKLYLDEVPEPSSIVLLASGLIGLLCYAWRKRK